MKRTAEISDCGRFRFLLSREWSADWPRCAWLMLNPSTADEERDDPTICTIVKRAEAWGYGAVDVVNVFPFRTSKPTELWHELRHGQQPFAGPHIDRNLACIEVVASNAAMRLVGFGAEVGGRDPCGIPEALRNALRAFRDGVLCLGLNSAGWPLHPMARGKWRIPANVAPQFWTPPVTPASQITSPRRPMRRQPSRRAA